MSSSISEEEVDRILGAARSAWRAGIERSESERASERERRLTKAWPRAERRTLALALAYGVAIGTIGTLALTHAFPHRETSIQAEAPAMMPSAAGNPAVSSRPAASETEVPAPPAPTLATSSSPAPSAAPAKVALPALPSARPMSSREDDDDVRVILHGDRPIDKKAIREASSLARGDAKAGRMKLRQLAAHAEPSVAFEAWAALARSYQEPSEELAVWDEAVRHLPEPYNRKARLARASVLFRMGRTDDGMQETKRVIKALEDANNNATTQRHTFVAPPPLAPPTPPAPPAAPTPPEEILRRSLQEAARAREAAHEAAREAHEAAAKERLRWKNKRDE